MLKNKKKAIVQQLVQELAKKNFLLLTYEAIPTKTIEGLKKDLKKTNAKVKIIKNSLLIKTFNLLQSKIKTIKDLKNKLLPLKKPTALVSLPQEEDNWLESLKIFSRFFSEQKNLDFRLALIDNNLYDKNQLNQLAKIPSRSQLIAKIISLIKGPTQKFNYSLVSPMQKFIMILKQKSTKGGEI